MKIKLIGLPQASVELEQGKNALDAAKAVSDELYRSALACEVNGKLLGLATQLGDGDTLKILTWEDEGGRWTLRHSASHVLAQAVKHLYPEVKLAIGPAIDNGFFSGTGISGMLRALEQAWGRDPATMMPDVRFTPNPNSAPNGPLIERSE